jgi:hypothetical protein
MPGFDRPSLSLAHQGADSTTEYTELYPDPLGEFMPEERPIGGPKRLILIEPAVPMSVEDAWSAPFASPREPRGRWFVGWMMLGVGLVAGFAAGMAVLWNSFSAPVTPASPLNVPHVERGNSDVPVGSSPPPLEGSADDASAAITGASRELAVAPAVAQSAGPGLFVQSLPSGAAVYLDGQLVSTTPFQLSDIAPGTYAILIAQPGYREWSGSVLVEPGKRTRISASLELE